MGDGDAGFDGGRCYVQTENRIVFNDIPLPTIGRYWIPVHLAGRCLETLAESRADNASGGGGVGVWKMIEEEDGSWYGRWGVR